MQTLLTLTLAGSVLTLLLLALRYVFFRKMPSTVYYYAWLLVLLRFVLPLPGLIPTMAEQATSVHAETVSPYILQETETRQDYPAPVLRPSAKSPAEPDGTPAAPSNTYPERETNSVTAMKPGFDLRSPRLWFTVWAAGSGLCFLLSLFSYLRFTGKLRRCLRQPDLLLRAVYASLPGRKPALYTSRGVCTPLSYGLFSPKIVLPPRDYDEELLVNILRHELTHYRRLDALYKWFSVAALSTQWFNPLAWLARREISRACELSCDEMLLRSMSRAEKQSYGNTLLAMAASRPLPAGVVATTFSSEKKKLKERLDQIMHYKKSGARLLAAVLALALLAGCGLAAGPAAVETSKEPEIPNDARVSTVDELLSAIRPGAVIELAEGEFDLSSASDYAQDTHSSWYSWNNVYTEENGKPGAELVISNVDGLTIRGAGMGNTTIAAVPRYANVIRFVGCKNLILSDLTAGHTTEPGFCSGGVLRLENCSNTSVASCGLYGCGSIGIHALDCSDLTITASRIYECSYNAVSLNQCRNVRVEDCEIDSHGIRPGQGEAMSVFDAAYSDAFIVHNCRIHDNASQYLLHASYTSNALFLSNDVHDNRIPSSMFLFDQYPAVVDGCRFETNDFRFWVTDHRFDPVNVNGEPLEAAQLNEMTLRDIDPDTVVASLTVSAEKAADVRPGGEIAVTTVDEFLSAIGPDRTIVLDGGLFDLSTASGYGVGAGEYYYWHESYDGPELVIHDADGLSIRAKADDAKAVTLAAIPRYANVLSFSNCGNLSLIGFTAGHTQEPGSCSGGVLHFQDCGSVRLDGMRLYGCGILGIQAARCTSMDVLRTEIYECSQGAAQFFQCDGLNFTDCDVHDVPSPAFRFTECGDKVWDGEPLSGLNGMYDVDADGKLIVFEPPHTEDEYHGGVEDLENPFSEEPTHHFQAGTPQAVFAAAVQQAIADDDWEALADRIAFPLQFFTDHYSFLIHDRREYLSMAQDGYFTNELFTDTFRFRERIAADDLSEAGACIFGDTCLNHLIAFSCFGDQATEDNLKITAISVVTPLWPGRPANEGYVQAVPPTPQPHG